MSASSSRTRPASGRRRTCPHLVEDGEHTSRLCDRSASRFAYIFAAVEPGPTTPLALVMPYMKVRGGAGVIRAASLRPSAMTSTSRWCSMSPSARTPPARCASRQRRAGAAAALSPKSWTRRRRLAPPQGTLPLHRLLTDYDAIADAACDASNRYYGQRSGASLRYATYPRFHRSDIQRKVSGLRTRCRWLSEGGFSSAARASICTTITSSSASARFHLLQVGVQVPVRFRRISKIS